MTEPRTDEPQEQAFQEFAEIGKLAARWLPGRVLEGLGAVPDHAVVRAAAKRVKELEGPAWHCEQVAKTAAAELERATQAVRAKEGEIAKVTGDLAAVDERVRTLESDATEEQKVQLGSVGWFLERRLRTTLEPERRELQEALDAAKQRADETRCEVDAAHGRLQIARIAVQNAIHQVLFLSGVDWLLALAEHRDALVTQAFEIRERFQFPEAPGRAGFLLRDHTQARSKGWEALKQFVNLPEGGYTLTPGSPRDSFSLLAGNGGEPPPGEPVETEAEPDDGWVDALIAEEQEAELQSGMPLGET